MVKMTIGRFPAQGRAWELQGVWGGVLALSSVPFGLLVLAAVLMARCDPLQLAACNSPPCVALDRQSALPYALSCFALPACIPAGRDGGGAWTPHCFPMDYRP